MRRTVPLLVAAPLTLALTVPAVAEPPAPDVAEVTTDNETPVLYDDDAGGNASGDDPAIWVHPADSSRSIVIATAKEGGLRVYDLDSAEVQTIATDAAPRADGADGRYNNVDIAYDVPLGGESTDVAVVSDRYNDQLRFWAIDPAGADAATPLTEVTAPELPFLFSADRGEVDDEQTAYGTAVYQPGDGSTYAVVTQEANTRIATVELTTDGDTVGYTDISHLDLPGEFALPDGSTWTPCQDPGEQPHLEGVSVDHRTGVLYAGQEDVGVWRIPLPLGSGEPRLIDTVADFGVTDEYDAETDECEPVDEEAPSYGGDNLVADVEGVDLYYGPGRTGYLIVSSQGDDRFAVYSLTGRNKSLGTFRVRGDGVDDIHGSDGLAVTHRVVGDFREGLLVTHDEPETGPGADPERAEDATSFSYVDWGEVADVLGLKVDTTARHDPRFR